MAQISIREYDVKRMFADFSAVQYTGIQIKDIGDISSLREDKKYVLKPDMLFGKRGKRGLVGINLDTLEAQEWGENYLGKAENIDGVDGTLDVLLAEEMREILQEYYISFSQERDAELVHFSPEGGVDIEENWDSVKTLKIPYSEKLTEKMLENIGISEKSLREYILNLWNFYRAYGFVSLECNPIAQVESGEYIMIDAVAKIDDCEMPWQKENWRNLEIPNSYGFRENTAEKYIRDLDAQTGASLKLTVLNENAAIWTLFAGGGGSLVMTDTLGTLGFAGEIGNYGECSGNPSREFTREYTKSLLELLIHSEAEKKYLIIAGAIANFTDVEKTFSGVIDAFEIHQENLRKQQVQILVRRGGINETAGLKLLEGACMKLGIPAKITGSDTYMTDILQEIKL